LKLDTLCKYYGIGEQGDVHGSEVDAILAGRLYLALKGKAGSVAA
jgi:DNA polymerase III epsilon subunit-like protein